MQTGQLCPGSDHRFVMNVQAPLPEDRYGIWLIVMIA